MKKAYLVRFSKLTKSEHRSSKGQPPTMLETL